MDWTRVDAVADELAASRAELLGLLLLLAGGAVVSWLVVRGPASSTPVVGASSVARPATADDAARPTFAPATNGEDEGGAGGDVPGAGGTDGSRTTGGTDDMPSGDPQPAAVVVHVAGAVERPGVVELAAGDRVVDAVTAAGGASDDAAIEALNMARPVVDGERILVPTPADVAAGLVVEPPGSAGVGDDGSAGSGGGLPEAPAGGGRRDDGRIDLNRATAAELETLPGVGPVIAERIIAWRASHDGFDAVGQLREVAGIGEKTFQAVAGLLVVE